MIYSDFQIILFWLMVGLLTNLVLGAVFWASMDDGKGTLLKKAKEDHIFLPEFLMFFWTVFAVRYLYLYIKERYFDN